MPFIKYVSFFVFIFFTWCSICFGNALSERDFPFELFKSLSKQRQSQSFVFSPLAVQGALGMVGLGAKGLTQKQLGKIPDTFPEKKTGLCKFSLASRLWVQMGVPLLDSFMELSEKNFGFKPWIVDFTQDADFLVNRVNDWTKEKTAGRIKNVLEEDFIDPSMKMLLTSAFYFKGHWARAFALVPSGLNESKIMQVQGSFNYFQTYQFQFLEMPYSDPTFSFFAILPTASTSLSEVEDILNEKNFTKWMKQSSFVNIKIRIPAIEFDSNIELSSALKALGISEPFSKESADFSGMNREKKLYLAKFFHKTFISLSKEETEGESQVAPFISEKQERSTASEPLLFEVNRSFIFIVYNKTLNTLFLFGRVFL